MRVSEALSHAFGEAFQEKIAEFFLEKKWITASSDLNSKRFLARSVLPHLLKMSQLFNRKEEADTSLASYWKKSSNPVHFRMAYFLGFMPPCLFRVASVWNELHRLGYVSGFQKLEAFRAIEFGSGPASGACGIAAGEYHTSLQLPSAGTWALIDQDRSMVQWGGEWAKLYFQSLNRPQWEVRPFHRKIDVEKELLPRAAPSFHLWVLSYYLNEIPSFDPPALARLFLKEMQEHLEEEGLVILVEPALKEQSRKLLAWREALLSEIQKQKLKEFQLLTPCLGHQKCGAFAQEKDWCHEEVTWWRPPYLRILDELASLDRKTLPFSYLVLTRSKRDFEDLFPSLKKNRLTYRLVSPPHSIGRKQEIFTCSIHGKERIQYHPSIQGEQEQIWSRGDILLNPQMRVEGKVSYLKSVSESK